MSRLLPSIDEFENVEVDGELRIDGKIHKYKAFRLLHKITGLNFGEYFQAACRSPEWKAALIIMDKYKRKMEITRDEFLDLRYYIEDFAAERKAAGKKCSNDFLVQEASAYIKKLEAQKKLKQDKLCQTENLQ